MKTDKVQEIIDKDSISGFKRRVFRDYINYWNEGALEDGDEAQEEVQRKIANKYKLSLSVVKIYIGQACYFERQPPNTLLWKSRKETIQY